jgi:dUTP pyrophosphatase
MAKLKLLIKKLHSKDIPLPKYMTKGACGLDLYAAVEAPVVLKPLDRTLIPTGIAIELPKGFEAQIRPRSGLALKYGVTILNSPGTIDEDYRGELKILLINLGKENFVVNRGDRIAQLIISKCYKVEVVEVEQLNDTKRNQGGFGHTGIK